MASEISDVSENYSEPNDPVSVLEIIRSNLMALDDHGDGHPDCPYGWRNMDATAVDLIIASSIRLAIDTIDRAKACRQ